MPHPISDLADLPDAPGAYAMVIRLAAPLRLSRRRWLGAALEPDYMSMPAARGDPAASAPACAAMRGHRRRRTGTWTN